MIGIRVFVVGFVVLLFGVSALFYRADNPGSPSLQEGSHSSSTSTAPPNERSERLGSRVTEQRESPTGGSGLEPLGEPPRDGRLSTTVAVDLREPVHEGDECPRIVGAEIVSDRLRPLLGGHEVFVELSPGEFGKGSFVGSSGGIRISSSEQRELALEYAFLTLDVEDLQEMFIADSLALNRGTQEFSSSEEARAYAKTQRNRVVREHGGQWKVLNLQPLLEQEDYRQLWIERSEASQALGAIAANFRLLNHLELKEPK